MEARLHLTLEGEGSADLVGGLVQVLGVERGPQTQSHTSSELDVVGQGGDTTVVDLGLFLSQHCISMLQDMWITDLSERAGVQLVLGGNFQTNVASSS